MNARLLADTYPVLDQAALDLLFSEARTANAFTDEPVSPGQLRMIYELTKFGPTAFNNQPLRITYVSAGESRERLVAHLNENNKQKTLDAPMTAVLAFDAHWHDQLPAVFPHRPQLREGFVENLDLRYGIGRDNAHLQAGYFILAARALGLAAGPMTGFNKASLDADFFPDGSQRSILVANIGYAAEKACSETRLPRLPYEEAVTVL
ncbi:malonic semialdehyde reductase [Arthrobacter sp. I2-34]|uniref:Malonic semialdehyde reductase n=1 Tax=Arthrobacter hankyongi TaxID=2904801 RepID=A0ABS9L8M5_9MICC|nr:malonic semialdehyde reductase [Arthrobacter hankyongi]MCG2622985.1 malonic semialdehyde reductase [Arthrobacter hankyongi]